MRPMIHIGRLYLSWGGIPTHHHFAKAGETWNQKYAPSQPRAVKWQILRAEGLRERKPLIWLLWIYPKDGSAFRIECGLRESPFAKPFVF